MMPPPNVTGVLHLGHALENSLMDSMARFQRLRGKKVLLLPGTDHAAIATQAKVEKMLMAEGMQNPRQELGREKLLEKIREFAEQSKATILGQIRKIGTSADWSRLAYTFDDQRNRAVKELFVRMYNDGLIYRGYRVVNWSVKGQSTCSDDEIEHVERPSKLYTFKYGKDFPITIATTRPETKLGDTAVAVHPNDERYKHLIGKTFTVDVGAAKPLEIKIIADDGVDPNFGTGALGVTPAHSAVDFAMYEKQKAKGDPIAIIPVIGPDGKMTEDAGKAYVGLTVEEAREKFVEWLKAQELLEKEEDIVQSVGTSDRYGDVIEAIPMTQWWLDMNKEIPKRGKTLRQLMKEAVGEGGVKITPDRFEKLYLDRVENLRDWCLSRQLWWGHRIPVWYKGEEMHVGTEAPSGEGWEQERAAARALVGPGDAVQAEREDEGDAGHEQELEEAAAGVFREDEVVRGAIGGPAEQARELEADEGEERGIHDPECAPGGGGHAGILRNDGGVIGRRSLAMQQGPSAREQEDEQKAVPEEAADAFPGEDAGDCVAEGAIRRSEEREQHDRERGGEQGADRGRAPATLGREVADPAEERREGEEALEEEVRHPDRRHGLEVRLRLRDLVDEERKAHERRDDAGGMGRLAREEDLREEGGDERNEQEIGEPVGRLRP
jgi:hypothetical protein